MIDYRSATRKAREQVNPDLLKRKNLSFGDIDVVRRLGSVVSSGFAVGFLLGVLLGALIAVIVTPRKGQDVRHLLTGAGSRLKGNAIGLVQRPRADQTSPRVRIAGNFAEEPAIEREIGEGAEPSSNSVETTINDATSTSHP
ncbi:MAG: hypothetical protein AVDCRST_MAG43-1601 [uncultured Thermomicrobiales bacterium]|uniref:YtxH domain-containing protein n=1 Tax=uncultured Thermomicrobiales bacterium TaxID=1645740 RepID=A0A6J4UQJ9_9BACT|nr:MAG: hypothetical protein AVDCRST_MAG43-1601 [uncultured Thermomicrobiales bacterium]